MTWQGSTCCRYADYTLIIPNLRARFWTTWVICNAKSGLVDLGSQDPRPRWATKLVSYPVSP
jgi:hypothetical protein